MFHGKTHYFDWAIFNSFLYVYRAGSCFWHGGHGGLRGEHNKYLDLNLNLSKSIMAVQALTSLDEPPTQSFSHTFNVVLSIMFNAIFSLCEWNTGALQCQRQLLSRTFMRRISQNFTLLAHSLFAAHIIDSKVRLLPGCFSSTTLLWNIKKT